MLHTAGWEPLDLVAGVGVVSVPVGVWNWGSGAINLASDAYNAAVDYAARQLRGECAKVHGHGVVGVRVDVSVWTHHIEVGFVGTAVRPMAGKDPRGDDAAEAMPFVSDLSARDFTLLLRAGWMPVGLAFGASFVYSPRRTAGAALRQSTQNVELTNYTQAMYAARESAMERMQRSALDVGGQGVVEVKVTEGPVSFARHAVSFVGVGHRRDAGGRGTPFSSSPRWSCHSMTRWSPSRHNPCGATAATAQGGTGMGGRARRRR